MTPDLVVLAGTVHTLAEGPPAQAVAVTDGVVTAVGPAADAHDWRGPRTEVLDLGTATLLPGLTDGHMHPVSGLQMAAGTDLSAVTDLGGLRSVLAEAARGRRPDEWVLAWGLDPNVFGRTPVTAAEVEDALGGRPALLRLFDAHGALATREALRIAGVDGPREFDQRARVVCDADGGPTGLLLEWAAMDLVARVAPVAPVADRAAQLTDLLRGMAASGLTGGHVMDFIGDSAAVLAAAEERGDLPLRLRFAPWCMPGTDADGLAELVDLQRSAGRRWRVGGVKFMVDGTVDGGTAWLDEPDAFGESTESFWPDPQAYTRAVRTLAEQGVPTATHAIGDAAVAHVVRSLAGVTGGATHRVEHLETMPGELVRAFAASGLVASMQPTHCTLYSQADHSDNWSHRLGDERASGGWRCGDLRRAGVTLALGSDWPVAPYDPRPVMADAQLRRPAGRRDSEPVQPGQALTARQALEGYTTHAAAAWGETQVAGRIAVGMRADLTALELDPLTTPPDEAAQSPVLLTVVSGVPVHRAVTVG